MLHASYFFNDSSKIPSHLITNAEVITPSSLKSVAQSYGHTVAYSVIVIQQLNNNHSVNSLWIPPECLDYCSVGHTYPVKIEEVET